VPDVGDTLATALNTGLQSAGGTFTFTEPIGDGPFGNRDVDIYRFTAPANSGLRARTSLPSGGHAMDTVLRLFDASGTELARNDDDPAGGLYSALIFPLDAAGVYYVGVSGSGNDVYDPTTGGSGQPGSTGDYQLDLILEPPDVGDTLATALDTGGRSLGGTFSTTQPIGNGPNAARDVDLYRFQASANSSLTVRTLQPTGGRAMDTVLRLFSANGTELAVNDNDPAGGLYSAINFIFPKAGTYYVGVSGANNSSYNPAVGGSGVAGSVGDYRLDLSLTTPDVGDTLATALATGFGPAPGTFSYTQPIGNGPSGNKDVDIYSFQAPANSLLRARTSMPPGTTSLDTILRLFDANGNELAFNDDDPVNPYYSSLSFAITTAGTYYFGVSAYPNDSYNPATAGSGGAGGTGDYRLDLALTLPEVRGTAYVDTNGNGRRDAGEPPLAGVTVFLDLNNNGILDSGEPTQVTDANGNYAFTGIAPGPYAVVQVTPAAYRQTFPRGNLVVGPVVNSSRRAGDQGEASLAINPLNPSQVFAVSVTVTSSLSASVSSDGGVTWANRLMATGTDGLPTACCDAQTAFDQFGNLFLTYINAAGTAIIGAVSTDGGLTFRSLGTIDSNSDQPSIATGPGDQPGTGSVWISYNNSSGVIAARGARVTGLGAVQAFSTAQTAPGSTGGDFGNVAVGPNGQVMVTYQNPTNSAGPSVIYVNVDADGLGSGGFGPRITASTTNVGGFRFLPAADTFHGIDAEANLAWDRSGGPHNGRVYLVYTDAPSVTSNDTNIFVRFSDDTGATWSAPVRVNDDVGTTSQFLPAIAVDQSTGNVAVTWYDARHSVNNTTARYYASVSTDGGASFQTNVPVSPGISDVALGPDLGIIFGFGDFMTFDFVNGKFIAVWADNTNSTGDNPDGGASRFDIYTAVVSLSASPVAGPEQVFVGPGQIVQGIDFGDQAVPSLPGRLDSPLGVAAAPAAGGSTLVMEAGIPGATGFEVVSSSLAGLDRSAGLPGRGTGGVAAEKVVALAPVEGQRQAATIAAPALPVLQVPAEGAAAEVVALPGPSAADWPDLALDVLFTGWHRQSDAAMVDRLWAAAQLPQDEMEWLMG
jgi:hypothetical protein